MSKSPTKKTVCIKNTNRFLYSIRVPSNTEMLALLTISENLIVFFVVGFAVLAVSDDQ